MLTLLLAAVWAQAPVVERPPPPAAGESQTATDEKRLPTQAAVMAIPPPSPAPRLWPDIAVAASGSLAVALLKPDIRQALLRDARLSNVAENFVHPIRQVRRGTERDSDPFWVNNLAHPGLFALEALYLKRRGYRDGKAFLFTQVHSVVWEFAVEGSAFEPSGKDLVADAAGAAAALWILRPLAAGAQRRIAAGRGRWYDGALRWLDPVSRVAPGDKRQTLSLRPSIPRGGVGLELSAGF